MTTPRAEKAKTHSPTKGSAASGWDIPRASHTPDDPLLGCLLLLTRLYDSPISADALCANLPLQKGRLTPSLFVRAAQRAGLSARIVRRNMGRISALVLPAVLLLTDQRACVLVEMDQEKKQSKILLGEAGAGEKIIATEALLKHYSGYAIFVQPTHRFDARTPELQHTRARHWFWSVLFGNWRIYRDVLVASFLVNVFALATPLFIMNVYDRVVPNHALETLWVLAIGVGVVYFFDFLIRSLRGYFIDVAGKKADIQISARVFSHVMGLKLAVRPNSVGAFANKLKEFERVQEVITSATVTTLVDLPFAFLFIAVIAMIGGVLALAPLLAVPLIIFYGLLVQIPLRNTVAKSYRAATQKNAILVEAISGAETIKSFGAEGLLQRKWERAATQIAYWGNKSRMYSASAVNVAEFIRKLTIILVVVWGVYLVVDGQLSAGALMACFLLSRRAMGALGKVAGLATRYVHAKTALTSLGDIMQLPVDRPEGKTFLSRPHLVGEIEFDRVTFAYPEQQTEALREVSFHITPGEHVAIIGPIGSGKTTIEKLVQGLYDVGSGSVRIDGTDIRQLDPADLRRSIGYVPQDITLFYGSVRDNISLGVPHAEDAAILRAANLSGVTTFVERHPAGYDMPVGEQGRQLSGGQRQSIAIARALLLDPAILLMDEPTNSMDNRSEELIKKKLKNIIEKKTVIIVTHRASLLALVDRIIVMENGSIIADGPKEEVIKALKQGKLERSS